MAYDPNGNLIKDLDRDIVTIKYNLLNLPEIIQFKNGNQIRNLYDASGQKLQTMNINLNYNLYVPIAEGNIFTGIDPSNGDDVYNDGSDYCGNVEYYFYDYYDHYMYYAYNDSEKSEWLDRVYNSEGYCSGLNYPLFNYYRRDHLGNNREVWRAPFSSGNTNFPAATIQRTQYYPSGLPWASTSGDNPGTQNKKFNGCEFIEMHGLDVTDLGNRGVQNATNRFTSMDRFCEKFPWQSPYVHAGNNPVNYVDVMGDSIVLTGVNIQQTIMAVYNGMADDSKINMKFNNGVLDPSSIENEVQNTNDFFLQDLYEIAINPTMVELSTSNVNTYMKDGIKVEEDFNKPFDYDTNSDPQAEKISKNQGDPIGKTFNGNTGQTLVSKERSLSGKYSTSNNLQIIINAKGTLNHQTVGLSHEFGHVILYLRNQYHGHSKESDVFIRDQRATKMSRRLGYDF